jgi:hypothetical protein
MHVNLLRTGVGVESVHHLYEIQQTRRFNIHMEGHGAFLTTRGTPTRANEILNGGSVYWIIKKQICVRQLVDDIQTLQDNDGKKFCLITMQPELMLTVPRQHKHIQGWRYLPQDKAPEDFKLFDPNEEMPEDIDPSLSEDLKAAGLL